MEFYNLSYPRARKEHICEYCEQKIHKGEIYSYETGKYEGDMFVRKLCCTCKNILDLFLWDSSEEEFDWWCVTDWLSDLYCHDCKHGTNADNDCKITTYNCPLIRKKFEPKFMVSNGISC